MYVMTEFGFTEDIYFIFYTVKLAPYNKISTSKCVWMLLLNLYADESGG